MSIHSRAQRFEVLPNGTLVIQIVQVQDRGTYICSASSLLGRDRLLTTLEIWTRPPHMPYKEVTIHQGGQVHLECQADGVPAPLLSWVLPNRSTLTSSGTFSNRIHMDTNGTLHISVTLPTDQGVYRCVASNSAGAASASVRLHVSLLPPVIQQPREEHLLFSVGWPVYAHCSARGAPTPILRWQIPDGTLVRPSQRQHTVFDNGTLLIPAVGEGDEGEYICYAENQAGQDSMKFTNDRGHNFIKVQQGETATIPCRTTGDPAPTVTWFSPSFIIIPQNLGSGLSSQRVVAISDGTLEVSSAQKIDSGNYTCRASNSAGIRSMVVTLEVETSNATQSLPTRTVSLLQHSQRGLGMPDRSHSINSSPSGSVSKPTVSTSTSPLVSTINGETLRLHCPASTTRGSVSWTMPSGKILSRGDSGDLGRYVVQEDGTLIIKQVSVFDRGSYICRFSSHDSSSVSVTTVPVIVIAYPPRITIGPSPVTYTRGGVAVELPCMAIATPRATVSWETPDLTQLSVMGQPRIYGNLYLSPQGSLVIQNPTHRDTGFYRCIAKNVIGVDSKATYLHVM
uniref:Ig-like domain-containing protein n=1 Tax=Xiphophorus couchianus TaxID=32473 RepID=A0A3B5KP80_9TELE